MNPFFNHRNNLTLEEHAIAIFFSGQSLNKKGDEQFLFVPQSNFYYLTGIAEENCILIMDNSRTNVKTGQTTTLFIPRENGDLAKWVGERMTKDEAEKTSGITEISYIDEFDEALETILFRNHIQTVLLDLERRSISEIQKTNALVLAETIKNEYPQIAIKDSYPRMAELRLTKDDWEMNSIRTACDITAQGFLHMMKHAKADMMEYELEAYFDFILKSKGVHEKAFPTIVVGGKRACILHYVKNNEQLKNGELVLVDAGATHNFYSGDVTRTFPINGKFTDRQKDVYNLVLSGQQKVIDKIAPDVAFSSLNELLKEHYFEGLKKLGLITEKKEVSKYYYHGVSHMLGLETHDVGNTTGLFLKENMVLTVEPGLYIEEWAIGIRIEDDILVTATGAEVLTKAVPKSIEDIENYMNGGTF
ncbi:MAG: aminopeptidase P family protein [Bacillota bacterium]